MFNLKMTGQLELHIKVPVALHAPLGISWAMGAGM